MVKNSMLMISVDTGSESSKTTMGKKNVGSLHGFVEFLEQVDMNQPRGGVEAEVVIAALDKWAAKFRQDDQEDKWVKRFNILVQGLKDLIEQTKGQTDVYVQLGLYGDWIYDCDECFGVMVEEYKD